MASGLQDIPLRRIPQEWDRQWFADFVRDVLRLGDARNMIVGEEMELTGQSSEVATLAMALGGIDLDKIEDQPGLSVIGNPTDSTGVLQALVASSDLHVMRRAGLAVGFGSINSTYISDFQEASEDVTAALIDDGTGISWAYDDVLGSLVGTVSLAPFTTTDLAEGSNLYFTDERAQDAVGTILTDSSSIDFTYTDGANQITGVVLPAGVNHNALLNYVADQHVAHTGVTLTAGAGLTGGGDISANRTFDVGAGTGITVNANDVALNQAFAPTWSAQHIYSLAGSVATPTILMSSTQPVLAMDETDQGTDEKRWVQGLVGKTYQRRSSTDNGSASIVWETITRGTGTAITNMAWGDSTNNNSYTFSSSGATTFTGSVVTTNAVTAGRFIVTNSTVPANGLYLPTSNNPGLTANSTKVIDWTTTLVTLAANLSLSVAGNKLLIKEGTNAAMGVATLVAGVAVVNTTVVSANSRIILTGQALGTVAIPTARDVTARVPGTSFTITSAAATDTSTVAWVILEPA